MMRNCPPQPLDMRAVGERTREMIRLQEYSIGEFADKIGVSRNTIYRLTGGGMSPSLQTTVNICRRLGCSVDFLLGLDEPAENTAEAFHAASLNILEYREKMSRKQKLMLVCALCGETTEEEEKILRHYRTA